ncbi:hypothetical protein [Thermosulfuriphilus sp.]
MLRLGVFSLVFFLLSACAAKRDLVIYPRFERIAVLPFEPVCPGQTGEMITCAISGETFRASPVGEEEVETLTQFLFRHLGNDRRFRLVSPGQARGLWASVLAERPGASPIALIQAIGRRLEAEAVLYGKVFRWLEREGTGYSVVRPASVAFALYLIRVEDGALIWRASFDETQKPLSENILSLSLYGRFRWLTANELAKRGLARILKDFPYLPSGSDLRLKTSN